MFWKRTTGHGAFFGLLSGTAAATVHHGLTLPLGARVGIKGGWLAVVCTYPSEMAQNFWTAIWAWSVCFVVTIVISLCTRAREEKDLVGLVYSLTAKPSEEHVAWYMRPAVLGAIVIGIAVALNLIFW
jgi:solute:Na+ symporter, SSS family